MSARYHSLTARPAALLAALVAALLVVLALATGAQAASTHVVNSSGDAGDVSLGDGVCDSEAGAGVTCTLRAALEQANAEPGVADGAAPHTISLGSINGQTITVGATDLPAVQIDGTVIEGCATPTPNPVGPCVGLRPSAAGSGTGLDVEGADVIVRSLAISRFATGINISGTGAIVRNSDFGISVSGATAGENMDRGVLLTGSSARIGGSDAAEGNAFAGNDDGLAIWGGDGNGVFGNLFGLRRDGTVVGNGRGVVVAGVAGILPGQVSDEATGNLIGGQSNAASEGGFCAGNCNFVAGSSIAGIDLSGGALGESPAGGLLIAGNWIGLDADGDAASNVLGVKVGDGGKLVGDDTSGATIGGQTPSYGNLISGNSIGVDQSDGQGVLTVWHNIFGVDPDQEGQVPNTITNARLAGDYGGRDALVVRNHFGASAAGLILTGPQPCVSGNFFTPYSGTYTQAAVILEGNADDARIGNELGCIAGDFTPGNDIGYTAPGMPAILIRGADDFNIVSNLVGTITAPPLAGPGVLIEDGPGEEPATGGRIGGDNPNHWNAFTRFSGPAVVIGGHATGIVVAGGEGIAVNDFASASSLWADLLSIPGLGNAATGQNNGIQPPTIGVATTAGIAGTGEPGATIRLLQRWRADNPTDGIDEPMSEGYAIPPMGSMTTVAPDGSWSLVYAEKLPEGQGITASQTTASGSSEFAALKTATPAPPLPVVQITGGPTGTVTETSATFTFTSPTPGAVLECAIDGADFASCSSPKTYSGLTNGAHQFRVQARVGSTTSLPVSRAWAVDGPATPAQPEKPGTTATAAQRFAALVSLPSNKRCLSKRTIRLRLRKPGESKVVFAEIRITGRRTKTVSGRALNKAIDLRGLPKGTIKVRVRVVLASGRVVSGTKTYRTCTPKKKAKKKTRR